LANRNIGRKSVSEYENSTFIPYPISVVLEKSPMGILGPTPKATKKPVALLEGGFSAMVIVEKKNNIISKYFIDLIIVK
jgi:hypothetical protein